jgi:hypothetical protein
VIGDEDLRESLDDVVKEYFDKQFATAIASGDLDTAQSLLDAAKAVGGTSGIQIVGAIEENVEAKSKLDRYEQAHEVAAYQALADNQFDMAM